MELKGVKQSNNTYRWQGTSPALKGFAQSGKPMDGFKGLKQSGIQYTKSAAQALQAFAVGDTLEAGSKIYFDTAKEAELLAWLQANATSDKGVKLISGGDFEISTGHMGDAFLVLLKDMGGSLQNFTFVYSSAPVENLTEKAGFIYGKNELAQDGSYTLISSYEINEVGDVPGWNGIFVGKKE